MKFTVDRSKWVNARRGKGGSCLLNVCGYRCCLGFCESQLGVSDDKLLQIAGPSGVEIVNIFSEIGSYGIQSSYLADKAMIINDDSELNDIEREENLQRLFLEASHEIEFIGEFQD